MAEKKHWIAGAVKHKGALHKHLGIPQGKKIPHSTLEKHAKDHGVIGKEARLALTLGKISHHHKPK